MRRRPVLIWVLVIVSALAVVGAFAALGDARAGVLEPCASGRHGTSTANTIVGNIKANAIQGLAGDDRLFGRGGPDCLNGGDGDDLLVGGTGSDRLYCGDGNDKASVDATDVVAPDCESVSIKTGAPSSGDYDITMKFRNYYPQPLQLATIDSKLVCVTSVDHPLLQAGTPTAPYVTQTTFNVRNFAEGCAISSSVVVWEIRDLQNKSLGTVTILLLRGQTSLRADCVSDGGFVCWGFDLGFGFGRPA